MTPHSSILSRFAATKISKQYLLSCCIIVIFSCNTATQQSKSNSQSATTDTIVRTSISTRDLIADSIQTQHQRDSLYSIKPAAVFTSDSSGDANQKMYASFSDTSNIIKTPVGFSEKTIRTYNKEQMPVAQTITYSSKRFVVKIVSPSVSEYLPRKLYINGREIRAGIEIDTSLSGSFYQEVLKLDPENSQLMKIGAKEYLFLHGYIEKCNGIGCGISFYMLYNPAIQKAMLLQQFRSDFIVGYDAEKKLPVFIDMLESNGYNNLYQCFLTAGKMYYFNQSGHIEKAVDKQNKQLYLEGYSRDGVDSLFLTKTNIPIRNIH